MLIFLAVGRAGSLDQKKSSCTIRENTTCLSSHPHSISSRRHVISIVNIYSPLAPLAHLIISQYSGDQPKSHTQIHIYSYTALQISGQVEIAQALYRVQRTNHIRKILVCVREIWLRTSEGQILQRTQQELSASPLWETGLKTHGTKWSTQGNEKVLWAFQEKNGR